MLVILHGGGNARAEMGLTKLQGHLANHLLDFEVVCQHVVALLLTKLDLVAQLFGRVSHVNYLFNEFFFVQR